MRDGSHMRLVEPAPLSILARRPAYAWFVVGTVCVGAFMGQLDASIAQLVLPTLETTFHARLSLVDWVALAYLLALGATLPIFGRLADMVGRKLLYTGGFLVFVAGSALCGFAPTLYVLIGARVFQAIGAGLLQANSVAIITAAAGPERRGRAIGLQGAAQVIGLSLGPALGGVLIQTLGWRWVFWINVPAGLLGAVLGWLVLPQTRGLRPHQRFDGGGAVLLGPALTALLLAVNEGRRWGWTSPPLLACAVGGLILLAAFVWHERRTASPLIDLRLFGVPAFTAGNVTGLLSYGILFALFFLLPFDFERGYGHTPLAAGVLLTTVPLALGVVAPLSGRLSETVGAPVDRGGHDARGRCACGPGDAADRSEHDAAPGHRRACRLWCGARALHRAEQQRDHGCGATGTPGGRRRCPQHHAHPGDQPGGRSRDRRVCVTPVRASGTCDQHGPGPPRRGPDRGPRHPAPVRRGRPRRGRSLPRPWERVSTSRRRA